MDIIWDDEGGTSVEYGLLVALIGLAITAGVTALGMGVRNLLYDTPAAALGSLSGS